MTSGAVNSAAALNHNNSARFGGKSFCRYLHLCTYFYTIYFVNAIFSTVMNHEENILVLVRNDSESESESLSSGDDIVNLPDIHNTDVPFLSDFPLYCYRTILTHYYGYISRVCLLLL